MLAEIWLFLVLAEVWSPLALAEILKLAEKCTVVVILQE